MTAPNSARNAASDAPSTGAPRPDKGICRDPSCDTPRYRRMQRREFLQQGSALLLAALAGTGCHRTSRDSVLSAIVEGVLLPDMKAIEQSSGALDEATARFSKAPTEATLLEARTAFRTALVRWKHGSWFLKGPPFESGSLLRATFWPSRVTAIDEL